LETLRGVSEADQARDLVRATLIAASLRIPRIFFYTLNDSADPSRNNQDAEFGLYRADGSEKPAAGALRSWLARDGAGRFGGDVGSAMGLAEPDHALAFRDGPRVALALWRWQGERTLEISDLPGPTKVVDASGNTIAQASDSVTVKLSGDVVWVETTK